MSSFIQKLKYRVAPFLLVVAFAVPSAAYDMDTHFYLTYMMARWAGISHTVAAQMAAGAQWIDVSKLTSPMFPTLFFGSRMRRLYHFPAQAKRVDGSAAHGIGKLSFFGEAQPNHPIASLLLAEGMRKGNFTMASAGLHVLQDSFGHAGFNFVFGHAEAGHNPDRFFFEPKKYKIMIERVFDAVIGMRELMPASALDSKMLASQDPRLKMSSRELSASFLKESGLQEIIDSNFLKHRDYVKTAVQFFLADFEKAGYFHSHITAESLLPNDEFFAADQSVTEALQRILMPMLLRQRAYIVSHHGRDLIDPIVKDLLDSNDPEAKKSIMLNVRAVIDDAAPGLPFGLVPTEEIVRNMALEAPLYSTTGTILEVLSNEDKSDDLLTGLMLISNRIIQSVLVGQIPTPLDQVHRVEFENDGVIRHKELELRGNAFKSVISKNFGTDINFEPLSLRKAVIASFKQKEAQKDSDGLTPVVTLSPAGQISWIKEFNKVNLSVWKYRKPENWYTLYQYPTTFRAKINEGFFKPLLTDQDVENMNTRGHMSCGEYLLGKTPDVNRAEKEVPRVRL